MWLLSIAQIDPQFLVGFSHRPRAGIGNTDRPQRNVALHARNGTRGSNLVAGLAVGSGWVS